MTPDANHLFYNRACFVSVLALSILMLSSCRAIPGQEARQRQASSGAKGRIITEIMLERSICFGECPAYRVTFHQGGSAIYIGEAYSPLIGTYEADSDSCPGCYFGQLVEWIQAQNFFDLQDVYYENRVDTSRTTVTVVHDGKTKTVVSNDPKSPIELWGIAMAIDGVVSNLKWKKASQDSKNIRR